jgi:hypothetical protein
VSLPGYLLGSFPSCFWHWLRPAGRVPIGSRPDGRPRQKEPKGLAPASGPALRSGFVTRFARPSGQPSAVTSLRSVSLHRHSRGTPRRAIPGPSRLSRHPCRSTPSPTIPLALLKGRLVSPDSSCIGIRLAIGKLRFPTSLAIGSTGRISGSCETRHQLPYLCRSGSSCHRGVQEALGLIAFQEILAS